MISILNALRDWGFNAFPPENPVLNRIGHALVALGIACLVTFVLHWPWRLLGIVGNAWIFPATYGHVAATFAYGLRETDQGELDTWDFYAAAIGAAGVYVLLALGFLFFL